MVLIGVNVQSAVYMKVDKPRPLVLFEVVEGVITKRAPDIGDVHHVSGGDLPATG